MATYVPAQSVAELSEFYEENGYVIIENALTPEEVDEIRRETVAICRGEIGQVMGVKQPAQGASDDEVIARYLCLHHPHKISDVMLRYMFHPRIVELLTSVIGPNVKAMQSMLFIKASGKPGQAWHQDENFIPTRDRSLTARLDRARRRDDGERLPVGDPRLAQARHPLADGATEDPRFDCADGVGRLPVHRRRRGAVEVSAGSVVVFNGYLLHRSLPNSGRQRLPPGAGEPLHERRVAAAVGRGRDARARDFRDVVLIAGEDPYAYKGVERLASPQVRPENFGGCAWVRGGRDPCCVRDRRGRLMRSR